MGYELRGLLRDRFSDLQPGSQQYFIDRYSAFRQRLGAALVGETLAKKYDVEKLAVLFEHGKLDDFLKSQGEQALLGGWFALLHPYHGVKLVSDHNIWPYFRHAMDYVWSEHSNRNQACRLQPPT